MTPPVLGLVTIGHSPRPDLEQALLALAPHAVAVTRGALDGSSSADIEALARRATRCPLLVRLRDQTTREIGVEWLHPLVEQETQLLAAGGADAVVICCAGDFPVCRCDVPVILPGRELAHAAASRAPRRRIGVVTPMASQAPAAQSKWVGDGFHPVVTWASPMGHQDIERAGACLSATDLDLVVLDCMGHDAAYAALFEQVVGCPVITAQSVAAEAAARVLGTR
ncbi:MAG: AroM family protein [Acidobacteriota bacterium]